MSTAKERAEQLHLVARLHSSYPELIDAPYPDMLDHARIAAYWKPVHDVGGEPDAPMFLEGKEYETWEHMTYVMCEVLAWRGIWLSEERRRIGNVDVGRAQYLGLPYYGRWIIAVARVLIEKHHIKLGELTERMVEIQERYANGTGGKAPEAKPRGEGDGSGVARNEHHKRAVGKGDPQVYAGQAGEPRFALGDEVLVREMPVIFYTRTPAYCRGATGKIVEIAYESPAAEDETFAMDDAKTEWFYVVQFPMADLWHGYGGPTGDTLQTEIPERWLAPAGG
ncbi:MULTISPECIES: SH3-like domain-containing protein [Gordonia]|uniref:nitrile hydratase n=3 Tax=Gordonia alkanivorans TaxID=84096 RepID=F9W2K0_9ACTN|nr:MULTISPECIES: SH3-like domain-containing protein [Gordonia]ETA08223.1 nitrile hydratase subunit beta [Gordonia alkanivorans CGMCC 6845]MDH3006178.1 nitrile hydratase subunit beta [Gordonia alkanivorans]MDH3012815.1 nitrile hydratase subunit beta [Gordonia alkanivorans]MDH3015933.1 nitrile hydratase subunit beta [Gordonia alkanivorans]MDH3025624.1 nitrile hydratase subunit beta [Gordonia alkanivorans]